MMSSNNVNVGANGKMPDNVYQHKHNASVTSQGALMKQGFPMANGADVRDSLNGTSTNAGLQLLRQQANA